MFTIKSDVWSFGKCIIGFCLPTLVIQKSLTSGHVRNQLALVQVAKCCASSMEANLLTVEAVPYSPAQRVKTVFACAIKLFGLEANYVLCDDEFPSRCCDVGAVVRSPDTVFGPTQPQGEREGKRFT